MDVSRVQVSERGVAALPVVVPTAKSSLVRRLVAAENDSAKRRIRAWLTDLDDQQLSSLGLTPEDIATLRGTRRERREYLEKLELPAIGSLPYRERRKAPGLDISKLGELDLSAIDMRTITPEEREAVMREAARRAHAERAKLVHDLINWLWSWCKGRKPRRDPAVQTYASSDPTATAAAIRELPPYGDH
jgi:hypothetical protein